MSSITGSFAVVSSATASVGDSATTGSLPSVVGLSVTAASCCASTVSSPTATSSSTVGVSFGGGGGGTASITIDSEAASVGSSMITLSETTEGDASPSMITTDPSSLGDILPSSLPLFPPDFLISPFINFSLVNAENIEPLRSFFMMLIGTIAFFFPSFGGDARGTDFDGFLGRTNAVGLPLPYFFFLPILAASGSLVSEAKWTNFSVGDFGGS